MRREPAGSIESHPARAQKNSVSSGAVSGSGSIGAEIVAGCIAWIVAERHDRDVRMLEFCDFLDFAGGLLLSSCATPPQLLGIRLCVTHKNVAKNEGHHQIVTQFLVTGGC